MSARSHHLNANSSNPAPIDWAAQDLPNAWPDLINWLHPRSLWMVATKITGRSRGRVVLPPDLPSMEHIPKYVLQEFHNLPNGNYSKRICQGYARTFEPMMLGTLSQGRDRLAQALKGASQVLDLGCGSGGSLPVLRAAGAASVWGIDPSPYLLQLAAKLEPEARLIHGVGEDIPLPDASLDGVNVCFVFHEIPPQHLRRVLSELQRLVKPGGRLAVLEPSVMQMSASAWQLWRGFGWRGLYFKWLAGHVFEPFVAAWHKQDFQALLREHGFEVLEDDTGCPFRFVLAQRVQP